MCAETTASLITLALPHFLHGAHILVPLKLQVVIMCKCKKVIKCLLACEPSCLALIVLMILVYFVFVVFYLILVCASGVWFIDLFCMRCLPCHVFFIVSYSMFHYFIVSIGCLVVHLYVDADDDNDSDDDDDRWMTRTVMAMVTMRIMMNGVLPII